MCQVAALQQLHTLQLDGHRSPTCECVDDAVPGINGRALMCCVRRIKRLLSWFLSPDLGRGCACCCTAQVCVAGVYSKAVSRHPKQSHPLTSMNSLEAL